MAPAKEVERAPEGLTDEQKTWARETVCGLDLRSGDWLVVTGKPSEKLEAVSEALTFALEAEIGDGEVIALAPGIWVELLEPWRMARRGWKPEGAEPRDLMPRLAQRKRRARHRVKSPRLSIARYTVQDGDALVCTARTDDDRGDLLHACRTICARRGLEVTLIARPTGLELEELPKAAMKQEGWVPVRK